MKYPVINIAFFTLTVCTLIVGCSSEPSEADIRQALDTGIERANKQMTRMAGKEVAAMMDKQELHSVKKLGCKEAEGSSGYNCDVEVDMTVPFIGRQTRTQGMRFVEGDDGWAVIQQ